MRALVAIVFWWVVLAGLWMLYVGQHTKENAVAGAVAAGIALGFGALLGRLGLLRFGLDARRLTRAATIPWHLVRDFGLITLALLRGRPAGTFVEAPLATRSAGERALVGLLGTIAPNAYVVDFDSERRVVLVHEHDARRAKGVPL